jgi:divalent metal cation (Fe/Co/Zn/Cd) transporter
MPEADLGRLRRRGLWLEGTTMAWTVTVAAVAITAGIAASSVALLGLGLESAIEMVAATVVIWQLGGSAADRETRGLRLIAITFLASAAYLLAESIHELASHTHSQHSVPGLAVASAALLVLPVLALLKRRTGHALTSHTLVADANETALTAVAAAAALAGTGLDTWLGWWQAVPAAGLVIAALAAIEGIEAWAHTH